MFNFFKSKKVQEEKVSCIRANNDPRDLRLTASESVDMLLVKMSNQILEARDKIDEASERSQPIVLDIYPREWYMVKEKLSLRTCQLDESPSLYWRQHNAYLVMVTDPQLAQKMKRND